MKSMLVCVALATVSVNALAAKSCEELKAEITAKVEAKGVKGYSLEVVPADQAGERKVVGTCDRGAKKIVYSKK
ncbi:DUF1161 domain-containing protein [Ideonella sp. YS5]|uniref:DUF1161 domain-containing protein n=1 Tax=Ideonella sp. YS5 TaxID=3453714 RepID=UPI003EEFB0BC